MKKVNFTSIFTIYQDASRAKLGFPSWTYIATERWYASPLAAAMSMENLKGAVSAFIDGQIEDARRAERDGIYYGNHGEVMTVLFEVGSLLDPFRSESAIEMGKKGGSAKSPAKTAASRENGRKGGRPRKNPPVAGI